MLDINVNNIVNNQQVQPIIEDLQKRNPIDQSKNEPLLVDKILQGNNFGGTGLTNIPQKPSLEVKVPISEGYDFVGGEYLRKFPTYELGRDNAEYAAQQQSTGEKWANGALKFGTKTLSAVVGGTVGLVYGVEEALTDGKFSSLYDNDFSNWMNDLDTKLNYQLPNYYTKQEQDLGLGGQMGTANFWADKFLGGLSFTAGALISEGIWAWATGGTSLPTAGARWGTKLGRLSRWGIEGAEDVGQIVNGMAKTKSFLATTPGIALKTGAQSKNLALGLGKTGEFASAVGFMARSAGYEASVEALQFKKEAEEKFYSNFADLNGREPNAEDIAQFEKDLESRANTVFGTNMAILGVSNLAMFGNALGIKNPIKTGLADFIDRKAFGYGLEKTAEGAFKTIERTGLQKASRFTFNYVAKPAVTEGLFEEGGQGLTTKYNAKWLEHTYDPKLSKETFDSIRAFNEAVSEQYGTKEGWVENGLGILIGIVGGSVNTRSQIKQDAEELKYKEAMANTWQDKSLQQVILPSKIQTANRIKGFALEAKEEALKGNVAKSELAKKSGQLAFINGELVMGSSVSDITSKVSKAMDTLTEEQWKEAGIENVQEYKDNALAEINTLAKEWKTNKKYWQYVIGNKLVGEEALTFGAIDGVVGNFGKNASIIEALAWQSTIGENANKIMDDVRVAVSNEVGEENAKILDALKKIEEVVDINTKQLKILQNQNKALKAKRNKLTNQIANLDTLEATDSQKAKRAEVTKALLETEESLNNINIEATNIADKISTYNSNKQGLSAMEDATLSTSFSASTVSSTDLLSLDENIEKFKSTLESLRFSNPQRADYLNELLEEYEQAKQIFLGAQATNRIVSSKDFKLENIGSFIGGKIAKNKAMNVDSQEWLQSVLNDYSKSVTSTTAQETEEVTAPVEEVVDNTKTKPYTKSDAKKLQELQQQKRELERRKEAEVKQLIKNKSISSGNVKITEKYTVEDIKNKLSKEGKVHHAYSNKKNVIQKIFYAFGLKDFNTTSKNKHIEIINKLSPYLKNTNVYTFSDNTNLSFAGLASGQDVFLGETKGTNLEVLNHELIHVVTVRGLDINQPMYDENFKNKINNLYKTASYNIKEDFYGLTNEYELLAEAFANPDFSKALSDVKQESGESVLEGLIETVSNFHKKQFNLDIENTLLENIATSVDEHLAKYGKEYTKKLDSKLSGEVVLANKVKSEVAENKESISNLRDTFNKQIKKIDEQISKIENKYTKEIEKIEEEEQEVVVSTASPLEQYKQRLENLLKTRYKDLISVEDETKPTQEEIQTFKEGKADDKLKAKLSRWKLYDASIDEDGVSVADLTTWINQAETSIEVEDTKDEIVAEDLEEIKDDDKQDFKGTVKTEDYTLAQNTNASATIVKPKDSKYFNLAHIKMQTLVDRLGGEFKVIRNNQTKNIPLDKLKPNDLVEVDGISLTYLPGGQIEIKQDDFLSRQQSLNLYIYNSGLNWSYKNLYEVKGNDFVKKSSDFAENEVKSEAIYDQKQGDKLTLEIDNVDGWNSTVFGGTKEQLKIYLVDSKGRKISTLKAFRQGKIDQDFAVIREEAFKRWEEQGRPDKMKLGIQAETENIFFGSPEIMMSENGTPTNIPITEAGVSQVVATGFIENGEISLNREIKDVSTVFVNKLSKNTNKKIPIVVIKKGAYSIAYPISMIKTATPQTDLFDGILQSTISPQEKVLKINEAILNQNIQTERLTFDDINNQEKLDEVRKSFEDKKVFVDAKTLADKNYKIKNLTKDAQINIDLENLDQAISDAKLRVSYKNAEIKVTLDDKNNNLSEVETELSDLSYELSRDYRANSTTKYLDSKGDIIEDTTYTNAFDDNEVTKAESHLDKMHNIKVLKQAFSKKLSKPLETAIGADKIRQVKSLMKQYDFLKKQIVVSEEELKEGKKNTEC